MKKDWVCVNCDKNNNTCDKSDTRIERLEEQNKMLYIIINEMKEKIEKLMTKLEKFEVNDFISKQNELGKKIDIIINKLDSSNNDKIQKQITYSQVLKSTTNKEEIKSNLPVIIIKPKILQNSYITKQEVQKRVNPVTVNASIKDVKQIKNGGIIIKSNSEEEIKKLHKLTEENLKEKYIIQLSKLKSPELVIIGSSKEYEERELINELIAHRYIGVNDEIKIKYTRKSKFTKKYIIYLETNGATLKKLVNQEISLGWNKCKIKENLHIISCFNCCEYGHTLNECSKNKICSFCSGEHTYWECKKKDPKCMNCKISNNKYKTNYNSDHEANCSICPIHIFKILKAKEKINYS